MQYVSCAASQQQQQCWQYDDRTGDVTYYFTEPHREVSGHCLRDDVVNLFLTTETQPHKKGKNKRAANFHIDGSKNKIKYIQLHDNIYCHPFDNFREDFAYFSKTVQNILHPFQ